MKKIIYCKFQIVGFHHWPNASGEVEYLQFRHRHIFYCKLGVEVTDSDREVEFITLKQQAISWVELKFGRPAEFNARSCEMIAEEISKYFSKMHKVAFVSVSEDDENGAILVAQL